MSAADSTTTSVGQVDDITQKLSEAMEENKKTEDQASVFSGERDVGYTTNPPNKTRDTLDSVLKKEGTVGHTADPPLVSHAEDDSDLFGGYTPEDTLGGGRFLVSRGIP